MHPRAQADWRYLVSLRFGVLLTVVVDGRLDGIFGQNRTVDFDRWQRQFFGNLAVF